MKKIFKKLDRRSKFLISTIFSPIIIYIVPYKLNIYTLSFLFIFAIINTLVLYWAVPEAKSKTKFEHVILPFFLNIAFCIFYIFIQSNIIFRIILLLFFAFLLYSTYLSHNIFLIKLNLESQLSKGAKIVTFIVLLISYFFLSFIINSESLNIYIAISIMYIYTYLLIYSNLWTYYYLQGIPSWYKIWAALLTVSLCEIELILWFWPTTQLMKAIFLTIFIYASIYIVHIWINFSKKYNIFTKRNILEAFFNVVTYEAFWALTAILFMFIYFTKLH